MNDEFIEKKTDEVMYKIVQDELFKWVHADAHQCIKEHLEDAFIQGRREGAAEPEKYKDS